MSFPVGFAFSFYPDNVYHTLPLLAVNSGRNRNHARSLELTLTFVINHSGRRLPL